MGISVEMIIFLSWLMIGMLVTIGVVYMVYFAIMIAQDISDYIVIRQALMKKE